MKYTFKKRFLLLICLVIGITGCDNVLDVDRVGTITPEQMWDDADFIKFYVSNLYNILPQWAQENGNTEEAGSVTMPSFLRGINSSGDDFPATAWDYKQIRAINVFFDNIDIASAVLADSEKDQLKGQAYFFRAYQYYKMVKMIGGVPIIQDVLDPTADVLSLQYPRNTTLECFDYIIENLDKAIELLPIKGTVNYENSRITKAAAMAFKGEVLLLKASPLFCSTPNITFWNDAYHTLTEARDELDREGYGLYKAATPNVAELYWYDKTGASVENVLFVEYNYPSKQNGIQQGQRPLSTTTGQAGWNQPTWELVQAYPMSNGKDISDSSSGYDPEYFWVDRDPRFYTTIVYNGAVYGIGNDNKRRQWIFSGILDDGYRTNGYNNTGFYSRKGIDTTLTREMWNQQAFDWPVIRYSEVLLNLAECANEIDGKRAEARDLIIRIRDRAHIEPGADNSYGLSTGVGTNYETTLDAIMKERQIEFAYEGKRFLDIRRRRMFHIYNNMKSFHAYAPTVNMEGVISLNLGISPDATVSEVARALDVALSDATLGLNADQVLGKVTRYEKVPMDANTDAVISIPERNYFAPLKQDWIVKNPKLQQNMGWDNGDFNPMIQ